MPRSPRLDFPGARHHVMNRGARRAPVFVSDEVCVLFLEVLATTPRLFGVKVHGYALMPDHYHLMLETPRGNLSEVMRHLGGVFTQRLNRRSGHDGPVFRGRYRNRVATSEAYWMHLLAYLHLNPVEAGLARRPGDCHWTSHGAYVGTTSCPEWLTCSDLLGLFGSRAAVATYVREVRIGRREAPESFDPDDLWRPPTTAEIEEPREARPLRSPEEALADVARVTGAEVSTLTERAPTPLGNRESWLAAWWLTQATSLSQREVAGILGVTRARVSQLRRQLLRRATTDERVRGWLDDLEG